jgi:DNA-binding SARP family transcriptional activator
MKHTRGVKARYGARLGTMSDADRLPIVRIIAYCFHSHRRVMPGDLVVPEGRLRLSQNLASNSRAEQVTLPNTPGSEATLQLILAYMAEQHRATQVLLQHVRRASYTHRLATKPTSTRLRQTRRRALTEQSNQKPNVLAELPAQSSEMKEVDCAPFMPWPIRDQTSVEPFSGMEIRCFGRFEVLQNAMPVQDWRRSKAKTLLKYLLVRRQPLPRDVLIDLLWPETDPQAAINCLRVTVHALRQALGTSDRNGSEYIVFEGGKYRLNPDVELSVDVDRFRAHFETGLQLERRGQRDEAIRHFEIAEGIYRDDYLTDDLYEDWTLVRREELRDQYVMVVTKLADYCIERGDYDGCIVRCHKLLQKDVCREDAYQRLMRCYGYLGQRSQARHWYELCVRTLRLELDVEPTEQTYLLYSQVSSGRFLSQRTNEQQVGSSSHRLDLKA